METLGTTIPIILCKTRSISWKPLKQIGKP